MIGDLGFSFKIEREIDGRRIRRTVEFVVLHMAMRQEEDRLQRVFCVLSQQRD